MGVMVVKVIKNFLRSGRYQVRGLGDLHEGRAVHPRRPHFRRTRQTFRQILRRAFARIRRQQERVRLPDRGRSRSHRPTRPRRIRGRQRLHLGLGGGQAGGKIGPRHRECPGPLAQLSSRTKSALYGRQRLRLFLGTLMLFISVPTLILTRVVAFRFR